VLRECIGFLQLTEIVFSFFGLYDSDSYKVRQSRTGVDPIRTAKELSGGSGSWIYEVFF